LLPGEMTEQEKAEARLQVFQSAPGIAAGGNADPVRDAASWILTWVRAKPVVSLNIGHDRREGCTPKMSK
jgi:hypothetical protein